MFLSFSAAYLVSVKCGATQLSNHFETIEAIDIEMQCNAMLCNTINELAIRVVEVIAAPSSF